MTTYWDQSYPPSLFQPAPAPPDPRASASPGDVFTEPTITAQDATNAAKLAGLGYVADPLTAWTGGQGITTNPGAFRFHWSGTAWTAGVAAILQEAQEAESESVALLMPESENEPPEATESR